MCTSSGAIHAFGSSKDGQVGNGQELNVDLPIELAKTFPNNGPYDELPLIEDERVIHVSCGYHHSAAVTSRGVLYTWGRDTEGCLGHGSEELAAGPWSTTMRSSFMPCVIRAFLGGVSSKEGSDGRGGRGGGEKGREGSNKGAFGSAKLTASVRVAIQTCSCGSEHTVVVDGTGAVWTWGKGSFGALGHGDTISTSFPRKITTEFPDKIASVAAGAKHTLAITLNDGLLFAWGNGDQGRLGNGLETGYLVPKRIEFETSRDLKPGDDMCLDISAGEAHSGLVTASGKIYTWGVGSHGRLGHNSDMDEHLPRWIHSLNTEFMIQIACGTFHTLMLTKCNGRQGGTIYVCGGAYEGRLGQGPLFRSNMMYPQSIGGQISASPVVQISCSMLHNTAADMEGHVWTWGWGKCMRE